MDSIRRAVARFIESKMDETFTATLTSTVPSKQETLTPETLTGIINRVRVWKRNDITIVVCAAHKGPPFRTCHPDGQRVEMSWQTAQLLHGMWPLVLSKIVSEHEAEFTPATQFDHYVPRILPMPPYETPPE